MATTTKTRSAQSSNGSAGSTAVAKAKGAGDTVTSAAKRVRGPVLAAGATAAGLAGGAVLGSRMASRRRGLAGLIRPQRKVLGVPVGRKRGLETTAKALGKVAQELGSVAGKASDTTEDIRQVRDQLDRLNRQSPVEVLLSGLTHRRGAHRRES
jgi:hypothetical protein